jgi:hypothetical protein
VLNKEKTPPLSRQGFFVVDKRFEISNHELLGDIYQIIKMEEYMYEFADQ